MRKIILILAFYILSVNVYSQAWCPNIGTYWYYTELTPSFCSEGYMKFDYYKDSLVGSNNCQMIRRYFVANCQSGNHMEYMTPIFTYTNSNVVYLNDVLSASSVQSQIFDTLFCFNVPIGFKWGLQPSTYTDCPNPVKPIVTVLDTGHRIIQGVNLKWQKVNYNLQNGSFVNDTIYERFGYLNTNPFNPYNYCSSIADADYYLTFRCYGDNQIIDLKYGHNYNCDYVLGVNENVLIPNSFSIYPNPSNDLLTVQSSTKQDNFVIKIYDMLGEEVINEKVTTPQFTVNTGCLSTGIYLLNLYNDKQLLSARKIVVQH